MDATALCIRLSLFPVLMMVVAQVYNSYCIQIDDAAFLRIVPDRLQFSEYESISINCEFDRLTGGKVMRSLKEIKQAHTSNWMTSAGSGTINPAFASDSGEYWCEDGDGQRSRAVNISVTDGSVILESPVHPVKEGDDVTLYCKRGKSSDNIADFYKDGCHIRTSYEGNFTIKNVSISHEGLYKCSISEDGESPESWLTVRAVRESYNETSHNETSPESHFPNVFNPPWTAVRGLCMALLLMLVVGLFYCCEHKRTQDTTKGGTNRGADGVVGAEKDTCEDVTKEREPNVSGADTQQV